VLAPQPVGFADQAGVATREQLFDAGLSWGFVRSQLEARRWRELNERVVVSHNGPLTWPQKVWAVYLSAQRPAAICGLSGMQIWRIRGFETDAVHVLVVRGAKVMAIDSVDVVVHESRRFCESDVVAGPVAPVTRLTRCVVDAAVWTSEIWTAYRLFVAPVQQRRGLAGELRRELLTAGRVRHRRALLSLANDLCGGADALSEVEFLRFCRRHDLPRPVCQRRVDNRGRWRYLDATFVRPSGGAPVGVEIDGGIHLLLSVRNEDTIKDNEAVLDGKLVLRFASAGVYADDPRIVGQLRRVLGLVRPT
jgi:hypothetical protein